MARYARLLVTGAAGFIGGHLLAQLRAAFPDAIVIAAVREGAAAGADRIVPFDLLDAGEMAAMLRAERPDAVVHLAAQASVADSFRDPAQCWRANVDGTLALARAVLAEAPEAVMLFASSAEVYGLSFQRGSALDESAAMAPANPYAASKAAADVALGEMALRGLRLARLRMFNQIGPGQSEAFAIAAFSRQIARAEAGLQPPVLKVGALDRWRDFIDVRDGCAAYIAALQRAETLRPGAAINIASGVPRKLGDILDALLARSRMAMTVEAEASRMRPTDVERVIGDSARAREWLHWLPRCEWDDTLDRVLGYWRVRARIDAA